jgi:hypothetical protein
MGELQTYERTLFQDVAGVQPQGWGYEPTMDEEPTTPWVESSAVHVQPDL